MKDILLIRNARRRGEPRAGGTDTELEPDRATV